MASRNTDMQAIFSELSEKNKDIVILIAKSVKVAQEVSETHKPKMQTVQLQSQEIAETANMHEKGGQDTVGTLFKEVETVTAENEKAGGQRNG